MFFPKQQHSVLLQSTRDTAMINGAHHRGTFVKQKHDHQNERRFNDLFFFVFFFFVRSSARSEIIVVNEHEDKEENEEGCVEHIYVSQ